jgi:hypothetical protein
MRNIGRLSGVAMLSGCMAVLSCALAAAQEKKDEEKDKDKEKNKIEIKFKLFDTNKPDSVTAIRPKVKAVMVRRDQKTKRQAFPEEVDVAPAGNDFWRVLIDKDVLIERLTIEVEDVRYSPADITKIITRAPTVLYPGVSDSEDQFHFSAYIAQMTTYKSILSQLFSALPDRREAIRNLYARKFTSQLRNLELVPVTRGRLLDATPEDREAALKLADEVLKLYGLRPEEPPQPAPCSATRPCSPYNALHRCPPGNQCWVR